MECVANPAMSGGPFIDYNGKRVDEVAKLVEKIESECEVQIELSESIGYLFNFLSKKANGFSLEPLYVHIPESLRGLVELHYDLNNNASFRIYESLMYKTAAYREDFQSLAFSQVKKDRNRPFILSTPRLENENSLHAKIPFKSTVIDKLFESKKTPCNPMELFDEMGLRSSQRALFNSFFSEFPHPNYLQYNGNGMRIRYFGHACILIEAQGISILIDPVLSYTYDSEISRLTYDDLPPRIDYVLITHSHQDHILLETILQIRTKIEHILIARNLEGFLADPSLKLALEAVGFRNVYELREMEEVVIPGGVIIGIPFIGEHHDLPIHSKICYLVRISGFSFLAMADSCNIDDRLYERIRHLTGKVDALFLGMECDGAPASWVYGPLMPSKLSKENDNSRRGRGCNFEEGRKLVELFGCSEVYVYAMGLEPWLKHILNLELTDQSNPIIQAKKLLEYCRNKGLRAEMLFGEKEILLEKSRKLIIPGSLTHRFR